MDKRLIVRDIVGGDSAVSTDSGNLVFKQLEKELAHENAVVLDFNGIELMTTAFLNAAIGQLYSTRSSDQLNRLLKLENVAADDRILFKKVVTRAKEYFSNKSHFEDSANNALYGS
ncbi:MAG: STAS-like domain-containing protein [Bacteroidales bacterium]|jgi:hypothetical protein|nr:STAS-like domain-containing protein [Bacteroidales bacterium]